MKTLGIDAHNLRSGGGLIYIQEFLFHLENYSGKFERIIIWTNKHAASDLNYVSSVLELRVPILLRSDSVIFHFIWVIWFNLFVKKKTDVVLTLSGMNLYRGNGKEITMFHSILPFSHDVIKLYRGRLDYFRYLMLRKLYKRSINNSDGILFSSKFAADIALKEHTEKRNMVSVVPFGIWTNFLKFRRENNKTPGHIRFLYVSNFYLYKRQLFLISVFEELISAGYDVSLTLCGDTYGHEIVLKQLTSSIIRTDRIKYIGKIPHKFIPEIYNNHDVLIFPSLIESFGIPLIEAQYFRLWILFSFQPAEEIMERNQYKRYKILGADMKRDLEQFIMKVQNGEITLENDIEAEISTFKETTLKTMEYLEEFLETKKSEL